MDKNSFRPADKSGRQNRQRRRRRRIVFYAVLTAAAVLLSALESLLPVPVPAPGFKLGLANTATLWLLLARRPKCAPAFAVVALRCVLTALLTGMFSSLLFSLAGGVASCFVMWLLLLPEGLFGTAAVSVAGAACHNTAQLAVAALVARDAAVFAYLPMLLILGTASGLATGILAGRLHTRLARYRSFVSN